MNGRPSITSSIPGNERAWQTTRDHERPWQTKRDNVIQEQFWQTASLCDSCDCKFSLSTTKQLPYVKLSISIIKSAHFSDWSQKVFIQIKGLQETSQGSSILNSALTNVTNTVGRQRRVIGCWKMCQLRTHGCCRRQHSDMNIEANERNSLL